MTLLDLLNSTIIKDTNCIYYLETLAQSPKSLVASSRLTSNLLTSKSYAYLPT